MKGEGKGKRTGIRRKEGKKEGRGKGGKKGRREEAKEGRRKERNNIRREDTDDVRMTGFAYITLIYVVQE